MGRHRIYTDEEILEHKRAYQKEYRLKNREKCIEKSNAWNKAHRDRCNESSRRWREAHPDKVKEYSTRYLENNREKCRLSKHKVVENYVLENLDNGAELHNPTKWTDYETEFLIDNYDTMTVQEIANELGRTFYSVERKRHRIGLHKGDKTNE